MRDSVKGLHEICVDTVHFLKQPIYLNFYDFRQCFDKLWLEDSIIALYKLGLNNELLTLIYKTNYKARITVKTPLGNSGSFTKTSLVKQGSVTASCLCSSSTGEFCDENKDGGVPIGKYTLSTLEYSHVMNHLEYSHVMNHLRTRIRFTLLKSTLIAVRGERGRSRKAAGVAKVTDISFNMVPDMPSYEA